MKQLSFLMVVILLSLFSCKKDNPPENNPTTPGTDEVTAVSENALATNMFDDVYKQVDISSADAKVQCGGKSSSKEINSCPTITLDSGEYDLDTWPKHITVDFGTTGCPGNDFRTRKGKVIYTTTGWFHDSATVVTVTTNNYYVDGYKIEGTKTITNNGRNSNNNYVWHVVITNGLITHPDGTHHTWATDRFTEWIASEYKFSTKGGANGITTTGAVYTITIDNANPLITQFGCRWIQQGILTLVVTSHPAITIDYGNGACDYNAVATINGTNYPFVMQ
ncbi:MAG: hypothetical protein A2X08_00710 [Bacteroidetes bacterium GWA2_32_17]|nr:MAG: hypothetical protein A2X08_00710 [Bacteroidetes bacterium GWA2_32_17]